MCIKNQLMNGKISDLGYELDVTKKKLEEKKRECEKLKCELKEVNKTILRNQQDSSDTITLTIPCSEPALFKKEISEYLYMLLYSALDKERNQFPENRKDENYRKQDVLNALLDAKVFCYKKSETAKKINGLDLMLNGKYDLSSLEPFGFKKSNNCGSHPKVYFYDKRYPIVFSLTPSDGNAHKQQMREIRRRCFLTA